MWIILPLGASCSSPVDTGSAGGTDTAVAWHPLAWGDCDLAYDVGTLGEPDARLAYSPAVIDAHAWFAVRGEGGETRIAHATIEDGTWIDPEIVLANTDLGADEVGSPSVARVGEGYAMWLSWRGQGRAAIWRCTSDDGLVWPDCKEVLAAGHFGAEDASALIPFALVDDRGTRMWYSGRDEEQAWRVFLVRSADGLLYGDSELVIGDAELAAVGANSAYGPFVWREGPRYRMLYAGRFEDGSKRLIERWSDDGTTWQGDAIVLEPGCYGPQDGVRVDEPWVVPDGESWRLYYDGFDDLSSTDGLRRVFTATAPL